MEIMQVQEITSKEQEKLPPSYISFIGTLEEAVKKVNDLEERLTSRNLKLVRPLNIFHIKFFSDTDEPYYQYAFELRKTG